MVEYKLSRLPVNGSIVGFNEFNQIKITMFDMFCLTGYFSYFGSTSSSHRKKELKHETWKVKNHALCRPGGNLCSHVQNVEHVLVGSVRWARTWPFQRLVQPFLRLSQLICVRGINWTGKLRQVLLTVVRMEPESNNFCPNWKLVHQIISYFRA